MLHNRFKAQTHALYPTARALVAKKDVCRYRALIYPPSSRGKAALPAVSVACVG